MSSGSTAETIALINELLQNEIRRHLKTQETPVGAHGLGGRANLDDVDAIATTLKTVAEAQRALNDSEDEVNRRAAARVDAALKATEQEGAK